MDKDYPKEEGELEIWEISSDEETEPQGQNSEEAIRPTSRTATLKAQNSSAKGDPRRQYLPPLRQARSEPSTYDGDDDNSDGSSSSDDSDQEGSPMSKKTRRMTGDPSPSSSKKSFSSSNPLDSSVSSAEGNAAFRNQATMFQQKQKTNNNILSTPRQEEEMSDIGPRTRRRNHQQRPKKQMKKKMVKKMKKTKPEQLGRNMTEKIEEPQYNILESVVLDAEIDKFLEDKALKNNLTATNVKSIIRHVITNNMVQKMVMSTVKNKTGNPDDSSEEEAYFEPKLTRARTKLLLEKQQTPPQLWPIVASPGKSMKKPMSETHALIHEELPEDSSGDEEYLPRGDDETHSDDENSSVASHASDVGSPQVTTPVRCTRAREALNRAASTPNDKDKMSLFKTPPPLKPKCVRRINDSAIGRRTRSKLPLNDTALEDLEMQLIPPDITPDMYDWTLDDNEDYLAFVKEFLCPGQNSSNNEAGDDDEADPEYNVMEDEEEHDKEELRMDRAVKVSKKELNELVAELLEESHFTSGDEFEETDYSSFCASHLSSISGVQEFGDFPRSALDYNAKPSSSSSKIVQQIQEMEKVPEPSSSKQQHSKPVEITECVAADGSGTIIQLTELMPVNNREEVIMETESPALETVSEPPPPADENINAGDSAPEPVPSAGGNPVQEEFLLPHPQTEKLFSDEAIAIMQHQMRQHIQLLAQSYVLTASIEELEHKNIAKSSKRLIVELNNFAICNGANSNFRVANLDPAWQVVNSYPHKSSSRSPIKKKILEEKYITDYQNEWTEDSKTEATNNFFPRHVVKVIAESPAFCYPELLPFYFSQNLKSRSNFIPSEDALLICGVEALKDSQFKPREQAKLIAQVLLPTKTPDMIYHRVRNLRKSCSSPTAANLYFKSGTMPKGADACVCKNFVMLPPIAQPREALSRLWNALLLKLSTFSELYWKCDLDGQKVIRRRKSKKIRKIRSSKKTKPIPIKSSPIKTEKNIFVVTSSFPPGMEMVQKKIKENPDLTAVPLMNINGNPGAYMFIPSYALPPPGYNRSPSGTEARESRLGYHPVPFYQPPVVSVTKSEENPMVVEEAEPMLSFTPVGKPFSLEGMSGDVINLSTLNTPLKNAIMEHAQEFTPKKVSTKEEHSARTYGNYVRGTAKNNETVDDENFYSSDDDGSVGGCVVLDEDVNLTEYEENCSNLDCPTPARDIICLEILEDSDSEEGHSNNYDLKEAGENGHGKSKSQGNKENSTSAKNSNPSFKGSLTRETTNQSANTSGGGSRDKDDEDDDDEDHRPPKRATPEDACEDVEKDEDTEEEPEVAHSSKNKPKMSNRAQSKNPKKHKKSPGLVPPQPPKKRTPKTTPVEKMLEPDKEMDEEACDAFVQGFILKIQTLTEPRHPGLHNEFLKLLTEDIESQAEFLSKVQSLFKDYPELAAEFATFVDSDKSSTPVEDTNFEDHEKMQAQLNFIRHLEKFTENSPQLKAKILHKFKILKEEPQLLEKDVAEGLAPFFQGNVVMMDAFKALFPSTYRPESIVDSTDFEEIDMEMDDPSGHDNPAMEFVKLPEEKNIPATNTCSCQCHENGTHAYSSRVKHCHKCCIKDGKVFVHNGRVIRPVNVELKSPSSARKILNGNSCRNCIQEPNKTKESPPTKLKEEIPAGSKTKSTENVEILTDDDIEEGEIVDDDVEEEIKKPVKSSSSQLLSATVVKHVSEEKSCEIKKPIKSSSSQPLSATVVKHASEEKSCETKVTLKPWNIEEDRVILTTCQSEPNLESAFEKLTSVLPQRDITEIESRCVELISLLQSIPSTEYSGDT